MIEIIFKHRKHGFIKACLLAIVLVYVFRVEGHH
jgi:hypothetical protein